ncbi:PREDICTED: golgin subfamily A member 1-like isoform X2 [Amphimedon queenslandica]|uniref:GRIP domain-containing protein n=1 Tax=Amphimedon queenslandica TaxID=400682 RepID=A0AAN0IZ56_AMPQE|nr:PREDICTED: golgin subfamily A member 1-like isoform X2 [Amphimedon queenslandica]|eukprot:XP_019849807.1 PREDICTED: golgin subfamily A member 1-like isoform X2 [Amphimedon queenslandica]
MFKRLKEKIEEEGNADFSPLKAPPGSVIRSQQEGPEPVKISEESSKSPERETDPAQLNETGTVEKSLVESDNKTEESDGKVEEVGTKPSSKKNDRAQSILSQLTSELVSLRKQYNQLLSAKEKNEKELNDKIESLEKSLSEKMIECRKMEKKNKELTWSADSLTSRLQIYGDYEKEDVIQKLQEQVNDLESRLRQRDFDIEIYETRMAAQSKQRHEDQMSFKKKTQILQDSVSSLQSSLGEKDSRLSHLNTEVLKIRSSLADVEKRRQQLDELIEEQKNNLTDKDQQLEDQESSHSATIDKLRLDHKKEIDELREQMKQLKKELKEKEEKLDRLVTELPDQPVVNTVLDGYSKSRMASSFTNSLRSTPGGVYRKEVEPLPRPVPRDPSDPALLPVENRLDDDDDDYDERFNPQYEVQLLELKRYSETLEEEIEEKSKAIKVQQQKINDLRKALMSKETQPDPPPPPPVPPLSLPVTTEIPLSPLDAKKFDATDINFQYLKNVVIRFICTKEDEALQLVKAISTLLELNSAEEKYIRDYLQYKLSWFGSMPLPPNISAVKSK